jgi:hypothetical protein
MTYPLGWSVVPRLIVKRERWPGGYVTQSIPLVYPGQEVVPDQPVLRLESGGVQVGASQDQMEVPAGLHGRVVGFTSRGGVVIESRAAVVQGMLGAGNQVAGVLTMWRPGGVSYVPHVIPPGAILMVPGPLTFSLLHKALNSGVVGIVASSIALSDLEGFLRTDFLQLLTTRHVEIAQAQLPPMTLLLTEGIGSASMPAHVVNLLHHYEGSIGLLSGVTSLYQHVFPELIISLSVEETQHWQSIRPDITLSLGSEVRILGGEKAGAIGIIDYFFVYEQTFRSGIHTRAVRLQLEDGSFYVVPYSMIERNS